MSSWSGKSVPIARTPGTSLGAIRRACAAAELLPESAAAEIVLKHGDRELPLDEHVTLGQVGVLGSPGITCGVKRMAIEVVAPSGKRVHMDKVDACTPVHAVRVAVCAEEGVEQNYGCGLLSVWHGEAQKPEQLIRGGVAASDEHPNFAEVGVKNGSVLTTVSENVLLIFRLILAGRPGMTCLCS